MEIESTATCLAAGGKREDKIQGQTVSKGCTDQSEVRHRKDDFLGATTKNIFLFGAPAIVLLGCALLGLAAWSQEKTIPAKPHPGFTDSVASGDSGESGYFGFSGGYGDVKFPLTARSVQKATVSTRNASLLKRLAIVRRSVKTKPQISSALKVAKISAFVAQNSNPCTTDDCRRQSDYLKQTINFAMDPCHDLYDFVCGNYWGHPDGPYTQAEKDMRNTSISALHAETVPARMQSAWQKAAGLFQACYGFVTTYRNELEELKSLMVSLKLDLLNLRASRTVDPADMVVRLALDIGAPAVFDLKIYEDTFIDEKRLIQFKISDSQAAWHAKRAELKHRSSNKIEEYIHDRLLLYHGFEPDRDKSLVDTIYRFDETLTSTLTRHVKSHTEFTIRAIQNMGERMAPLVTPGQWTNLLAKYTNDVYNGGDMIQFQTQLLEGLMELLQVSYWGREGFRTMLAWGLFDAQVDYAMPQQLVGRKDKKVACYDLVLQVMEISVTSRYLRSKVYADTLSKAKDMFSKVQDAFEATLRGSSWLKGNGLDLVLRRLQMMKVLVGGPGPRLDESFVNNHYAAFPDMAPNGRFLDSWLKALSARANQKWADQTHVFFNTSMASPAYIKGSNAVVIPVGALLPILFYGDGNTALNYGTLGDALGQQIMNAFDLEAGARYCLSLEANERYSSKKLCVRQSHEQAGYPGPQSAENPRARPADVSDLVGIAMAYEVLRTLPSVQKTQTLPGVNLTAEQLFFVGHCMTTCKYDDRTPSGRFAGPRARCNVPAMNMDAFSAAFGCGAAARMNPQRKCSFWK